MMLTDSSCDTCRNCKEDDGPLTCYADADIRSKWALTLLRLSASIALNTKPITKRMKAESNLQKHQLHAVTTQ